MSAFMSAGGVGGIAEPATHPEGGTLGAKTPAGRVLDRAFIRPARVGCSTEPLTHPEGGTLGAKTPASRGFHGEWVAQTPSASTYADSSSRASSPEPWTPSELTSPWDSLTPSSNAEGASLRVTVKNSFLHVSDEEEQSRGSVRRSASAPATHRAVAEQEPQVLMG